MQFTTLTCLPHIIIISHHLSSFSQKIHLKTGLSKHASINGQGVAGQHNQILQYTMVQNSDFVSEEPENSQEFVQNLKNHIAAMNGN